MPTLVSRMAKLEKRLDRKDPHGRVFQCIVRKGHENEDRAAAYSDLGILPCDDDLEIILVAVTPSGLEPGALRPSASVLR